MLKKKNKESMLLLVCGVLLFLGLVLSYGSTKNLGLIVYHPMSYCHMPVPFGF